MLDEHLTPLLSVNDSSLMNGMPELTDRRNGYQYLNARYIEAYVSLPPRQSLTLVH
ncbi:hypothetical protein ACLB1E_06995 [Escherichia coli]